MNIIEISNSVIAGLICAIIISIFSSIFYFIKTAYKNDKELFLIKSNFLICLIGLISNSFALSLKSFIPKWVLIVSFILNIFGVLICFYDAINYTHKS